MTRYKTPQSMPPGMRAKVAAQELKRLADQLPETFSKMQPTPEGVAAFGKKFEALMRTGAMPAGEVSRNPLQLPKPNKNRAIRCQDENGRWYASKLERKVAGDLKRKHGARNVIEQVSVPVGNLRIRPDFFVILQRFDDGSFRGKFLDAKGRVLDAWKAKANHLLDAHGIEIELVGK